MKALKKEKQQTTQQPNQSSFFGLKIKFSQSQKFKRDTNGKFVSGSGGLAPLKKLKLSRLLPSIVVIGLVGGFLVFRSFAGGFGGSLAALYNLKLYFPNQTLAESNYLEGFNYASGSTVRSVLWFERQDQWTYRMYNAAPQNADRRCNYDVLSWWDDHTLRYSETNNSCPGNTANKIVYDSPIILLPDKWEPQKPWRYSGQSKASYYEKNSTGSYELKCTGTTNYSARIIGFENVTPREQAIRWQTIQFTNWETGNMPGKCSAGHTTRWREDYWLSTTLRKEGMSSSSYAGIRRSKGGNLDDPAGSWDIWYDSWYHLPSLTSQTNSVDVTPNARNFSSR